MFKTIRLFLIPFVLTLGLGLFGQDDCPDDVEFYAPGEGEPGCIDYTDCNENGAFDYGEPCYDEPTEGEGFSDDMHNEEDMGEMNPIDQVFMQYGEHTWMNCEAVSYGAQSYWIGDEEFGTYEDPICEEVFLDFFAALDADGDGGISMEEASVVWGEDPEFETGFNENDLDGNGLVDEGEFMEGSAPPDHMDFGTDMTPVMYVLEQIDASFEHLDDGLRDEIKNLAADLEGAAHAEHEDDCDGCAGEVLEDAEGLIGNLEQGDADLLGDLLFMLECETHMEHNPEHDCGVPPDMEVEMEDMEWDGPMHPVEQVFMQYGEHTWMNCEAVSYGAQSYWIGDEEFGTYEDPICEEVFLDFFAALDADGDGGISMEEASVVWGEDPEFETGFNENDLDGNGLVDEGEFMEGSAPPDHMDHDGGEGDTHWADEAYQLEGDQEHYDRVMSVGEEDRENEYHMIMNELGMGMDHDGGWYCQICDIYFDTEEEMDDHADEMGHIHDDEHHDDEHHDDEHHDDEDHDDEDHDDEDHDDEE